MATVSSARFRAHLSENLERAQREPLTITSRGVRRRAVLVSAEFFDRASAALGDAPYAAPPLSPEEEERKEREEIMDEMMRFVQDL